MLIHLRSSSPSRFLNSSSTCACERQSGALAEANLAGDFIAVPLVVDAIDCGLRQPRPDADGVDRGCTGESPRAISCAFIALIAMYGLIYYVSHALRTFPLTHLEQYCVRRFTQNALIRRATRPATRVILVIGVDEFTIFMSFLLVPIKVRFATLEPAMRCVTRCVDVALCIVASTRNASFCCQDTCPWRSPRFLVLLFTYVPSRLESVRFVDRPSTGQPDAAK